MTATALLSLGPCRVVVDVSAPGFDDHTIYDGQLSASESVTDLDNGFGKGDVLTLAADSDGQISLSMGTYQSTVSALYRIRTYPPDGYSLEDVAIELADCSGTPAPEGFLPFASQADDIDHVMLANDNTGAITPNPVELDAADGSEYVGIQLTMGLT